MKIKLTFMGLMALGVLSMGFAAATMMAEDPADKVPQEAAGDGAANDGAANDGAAAATEEKPVEVAYSGEWLDDYEKAVSISTALGRPILADFTGSDWCPPCKMLSRHVFGSQTFKDWSKEHVVLLELDFPRGKRLLPQVVAQNAKLQEKFNVGSFPTIVIMDSAGAELGRHIGGMNDPRKFINIVKPFVDKYKPVEGGGSGVLAAAKPREVDPTQWRRRLEKRAEMNAHFDALEGKPAPSIDGLSEWINTDGDGSWDDYKGKIVILDYWATWCGPCRATIPHLVELQKKYADKNVTVLGVHSSNGWEKMAEFVAKEKLTYQFAADKDRKLGQALGVKFIPTYFVIDAKGDMFIAGANNDRLDEIVDELIRQRDANKAAASN